MAKEPTNTPWCTTSTNARTLLQKTATLLGGPPPRHDNGWYYLGTKPVFVGNIPKTSGPTRPNTKHAFLVRWDDERWIFHGEDLDTLAGELATALDDYLQT